MGIQNCFEGQPVEGAAYSFLILSYVIHKIYSYGRIVSNRGVKNSAKTMTWKIIWD